MPWNCQDRGRAASLVLGLLLCTGGLLQAQDEPADALRVLVWNVQRGANEFDEGAEKALAVVRAVEPDLCLLQESYDIDGERPTLGRWMAESLGWNAWQGDSPHLCILTPHAIEERFTHAGWHGIGARVRVSEGRELVAYSTWIDYRAYLPYALRDDPALEDEALLACETEGSDRLAQARAILAHLEEAGHREGTPPLLVGGDWNCPSHLDWTPDAARVFRHRRALDLPVSRALAAAGFLDAFRVVHPDSLRVPGLTWSPLYRGSDEEAVPADRIDRLYLHDRGDEARLRAVDAFVLPRVHEPDALPQPERRFPSDHGAVVVDFRWVR